MNYFKTYGWLVAKRCDCVLVWLLWACLGVHCSRGLRYSSFLPPKRPIVARIHLFQMLPARTLLAFASDLKLAHYVKSADAMPLPPRSGAHYLLDLYVQGTGACKINKIPNVCTKYAPDKMACPGIHVLHRLRPLGNDWPDQDLWRQRPVHRTDGRLAHWRGCARQHLLAPPPPLPGQQLQRLRRTHPVVLLAGGLGWAPYNPVIHPGVWISWLSWIWCKNRFLDFWSKYNFVLASALAAGVASLGHLYLLRAPGAALRSTGGATARREYGLRGRRPCRSRRWRSALVRCRRVPLSGALGLLSSWSWWTSTRVGGWGSRRGWSCVHCSRRSFGGRWCVHCLFLRRRYGSGGNWTRDDSYRVP